MLVTPALHPAFLLRRNMRLTGVFTHSLRRAKAIATKGKWEPDWNEKPYVLRPSADQVVKTLRGMRKHLVAYDVETDGNHPLQCQLRCMAFYDGKVGICVPLVFRDGSTTEYIDDKGNLRTARAWVPYFKGAALKKVLDAVKDLSAHSTFIYQNGQYDRMVTKSQLGISLPRGTRSHDTILAHHIIAPYLPHGLGFLAGLYTDAPFYKTTDGGESWASESDDELWLYNCLHASTQVCLPGGVTKTIADLVRSRYTGKVLAADSGGRIIEAEVYDWHRKSGAGGPPQEWVELELEGGRGTEGPLRLTADHKVYVDGRLKQAGQIKLEDELVLPEVAWSSQQRRFILGTLLGDTSIKVSPTFRPRIHESPQAALFGGHTLKELVDEKAQVLPFLTTGCRKVSSPWAKSTVFYTFHSQSTRQLKPFLPMIYDEQGARHLTVETLNQLGAEGLAWWFADDGCLQKKNSPGKQETICLALCRYSRSDQMSAAQWFTEKFGALHLSSNGVLRFNVPASNAIASFIAPFLPASVQYKIPPKHRTTPTRVEVPNTPLKTRVVSTRKTILNQESKSERSRNNSQWCISTTAGNFFTTKGLVKNCRDTHATWLAWEKMSGELDELNARKLYDHDRWQEQEAEDWKENGITVDLSARDYFRQHYRSVFTRAMTKMKEVVEVILVQAAKKQDQGPNAAKLDELLEKLQGDADETVIDDSGAVLEQFNPGSLKQLRLLLSGLGIPLRELTATGEVSTAKEFLTGARKELLAQGVSSSDVRVAFLDYLFAWREAKKVDSTYLSPEILHDGKVHPSFSVHVVPTGRLCIAKWTKVLTLERGWIEARSVLPGDHVWSHQQRWRKVEARHWNGTRDVVDMKLANGQVLTCTTDHRFLGTNGWVTVGELHEHLEALARSEIQQGSGGGSVQKPELAYSRFNRLDVGGDILNGWSSSSTRTLSGGSKGSGSSAVLDLEDRDQKPDEGQDRKAASALEGILRGRSRVLDDPLEGSAALCTPRRDDGSAGVGKAAQELRGAPHRRGPEEQLVGQSRSHHECWASADSLSPGEGFARCAVEEIVHRGRCSTVDLEVEDDQSFLVEGGVFSHNSSSKPNFQNQPAEIRGMFVADEGHDLVMGDWDALEMRLGAFLSQDPNFVEVFRQYDAKTGPKPHIVNAAAIFGLEPTKDLPDKHPGCYRAAKVFAYAVAYGAGEDTVFEQVREEMPEMDYDTFLACYARYKKRYPKLFQFQASLVTHGTQKGWIDTQLMRRRGYFFEKGFGDSGSPEASAMQNFPYQGTGADIVSQANKRINAQVLIPMRKILRPGEKAIQLAQVHDELLYMVPKRFSAQFASDFKRVGEEKPMDIDGRILDWNLPIDVKVKSRWKYVQTRCPKCRGLVDLESSVVDGFTRWQGECSNGPKDKPCGEHVTIDVPLAS